MRRMMMLLGLITVIICNGQNENIDSLRNVLKHSVTEDSSRAKALIVLAYALVKSHPDSSQLLINDALRICESIQWQFGTALALRQKGYICYYTSDFLKAIDYFQEALKAGESLQNDLLDASIYSNLGNIYADMGDSKKALDYYNNLLITTRRAGSQKYEAIALANIGTIYSDKEQYTRALQYLRAALPIARKLGNLDDVGVLMGDIGVTLKNSGDYSSALTSLAQAFAFADSIGSKYTKALVLNGMADAYLQLKEYGKAAIFSKQAYELGKEIDNVSWQADAYKILSEAYEKQEKGLEALHAYRQYILLHDSVLNTEKKQEITRKELQFEYDKKNAVAAAEINRQKIIRNASITAGGILVMAAAISFVFYKRRKDADTRKNEAELKQQVTDTEMKALRAQMNPHFIFNSLNSIADYIDKHQTQTASEFTGKFAKLMRMVLENSEHKAIPLADDLKALELYMQLERYRLQYKFEYTIQVDESIDQANTLVPPLILQPFVENSIWHGLAEKEGAGNIAIHIKQEGDMINCSVEDDGVGIPATKIAEKENRSLGMRITKERIDIINRLKNANASVTIFNKQKGVMAEVRLPLELSF